MELIADPTLLFLDEPTRLVKSYVIPKIFLERTLKSLYIRRELNHIIASILSLFYVSLSSLRIKDSKI